VNLKIRRISRGELFIDGCHIHVCLLVFVDLGGPTSTLINMEMTFNPSRSLVSREILLILVRGSIGGFFRLFEPLNVLEMADLTFRMEQSSL